MQRDRMPWRVSVTTVDVGREHEMTAEEVRVQTKKDELRKERDMAKQRKLIEQTKQAALDQAMNEAVDVISA